MAIRIQEDGTQQIFKAPGWPVEILQSQYEVPHHSDQDWSGEFDDSMLQLTTFGQYDHLNTVLYSDAELAAYDGPRWQTQAPVVTQVLMTKKRSVPPR